ncbi:lyase family protein [Ignisphaera sp. 4213-co]|mgnify:FL=1|uniref:Lyase family protein n=1 Tax=Ignisphaera cupida TaxID=3050454 RepID=A0ABD4Z7E8_9CREN|nr:lyase family protein [Ignisphaera sp. 4213-co]MDK6029159.1 lyase family protein [Ignisphaera sp. 4213-co]
MTLRYRIYIGQTKDFIESYFSSLETDKRLVKYITMVMMAHVKTLMNHGVIPKDHGEEILRKLKEVFQSNGELLYKWIEKSNTLYEDAFEALEAYLHDVSDADAGYVAIGRSRNDHIAAVLRLYIRDNIVNILYKLLEVREALLHKATEFRSIIIPFFTHEQIAQCGSASIFFMSYEYTLANLWKMLYQGLDLLKENPLGSGAASGSLVNIDRDFIGNLLCLDNTAIPPYYATGSRLFVLHYLNMLSLIMLELSRFAEDMIFLNSLIPNALNPPVEHVATSSIMPHKRNLVTMEIVRANASKVCGLSFESQSIYKGLPYGYNLDFQEINNAIMQSLEVVQKTLEIVKDFINGLNINENVIQKYIEDKPCWSSDLVEYIALTNGRPAREVYLSLARLFKECSAIDSKCVSKLLSSLNLSHVDIWNIVKNKPIEINIKKILEDAWTRLERDRNIVKSISLFIEKCTSALLS